MSDIDSAIRIAEFAELAAVILFEAALKDSAVQESQASFAMIDFVFELSLVHSAISHDHRALDSLVHVPRAVEFGAVLPPHCALAMPIVQLPVAFIRRRVSLRLHEISHLAFATALAVFEGAHVRISRLVFDFALCG